MKWIKVRRTYTILKVHGFPLCRTMLWVTSHLHPTNTKGKRRSDVAEP